MVERATLMGRDMVRLVALDLILRVVSRGVMPVSLIVEVAGMNFDNLSGHATGLRIPAYVISDLEFLLHLKLTS
jgi:hypothetical protein